MALPTEVLQYTRELETHMQQFAENIKNENFDELIENENGYRENMNAIIEWYHANCPNDFYLPGLKDSLALTLYRLREIRKILENGTPYEEAKKQLEDLGIII